mmetsp:Transcript_105658/g.281436  ORF Transcript_105658/g.281436 Transcript_105658/m.281436 type:complete len:215 (+) Transcript_105658:1204-1848(+)
MQPPALVVVSPEEVVHTVLQVFRARLLKFEDRAATKPPVAWTAAPTGRTACIQVGMHDPSSGARRSRPLVTQKIAQLGELRSALVIRRQGGQHALQVERQLAINVAELAMLAGQGEAQHLRVQEHARAELTVPQELRTRQVLVVAHEPAHPKAQAPRQLAEVHPYLVQPAREDAHPQQRVVPRAPARAGGAAAERANGLVPSAGRLSMALADLR